MGLSNLASKASSFVNNYDWGEKFWTVNMQTFGIPKP